MMQASVPSIRGLAAAGVALVLLIHLAACSRPAPEEVSAEPETVLARVGEVEITAGDLARHARSLAERGQAGADPEALLRELVERETLVQGAIRAGLEEDPEVREMIRDVLIAQYRERELAPRLRAAAVSEDELREAYDREKDGLAAPERVRLAMLYLQHGEETDEEGAGEKRLRLEAAVELSRQQAEAAEGGPDAGFGTVAASHSEDQESRYRGGEIGWVERDRYPARLDPAAVEAGFSLESPGEVSGVVAGRDGFYVLKLLERQESAPPTLEQAGPALTRRLLEEGQGRILEEFQSRLREDLRVEMHAERLAGVESPPPGGVPAPPSIP